MHYLNLNVFFRNEGRETRSEYDRKVDRVKEEWQADVKTIKKQHEDEMKKVKVGRSITQCYGELI